MFEIENEYDTYFACDYDYMRFLYHKVRHVLGNSVFVYTTDGDREPDLRCGTLQGVYSTVLALVTLSNSVSTLKVKLVHTLGTFMFVIWHSMS